MTTSTPRIEQHPDLIELRQQYERRAESPMVQMLDGATFLAGLYLTISPWVVGFNDMSSLMMSNLVVGIGYALLAMGLATNLSRTHGMAWVAPVMGLWVIISPFVVAGPSAATEVVLNNVVIGAICVLFGLACMSVGMMKSRTNFAWQRR